MASSITSDTAYPRPRIRMAFTTRILAGFFTSLMLALVKLANLHGVSTVETLAYRNLFAFPVILGWIMLGPGIRSVGTVHPGFHLRRSAIGLGSMYLTFVAVSLLPLAEMTTINFLLPLCATALSALLLKEKVGAHRWAAIVVGFIGIVVITRPGASGDVSPLGVAVALIAVGGVSLVLVTLRQLGGIDPPTTTVFWFTAAGSVVSIILLCFFFQRHSPFVWMLILGIGITGGTFQLFLTTSLKLAPVSITAPLDYVQMIWAILLSWLLWSRLPPLETLVGASLIAGAGLYTVYRERRRNQRMAAESAPIG